MTNQLIITILKVDKISNFEVIRTASHAIIAVKLPILKNFTLCWKTTGHGITLEIRAHQISNVKNILANKPTNCAANVASSGI
jgi:hypothetical protein